MGNFSVRLATPDDRGKVLQTVAELLGPEGDDVEKRHAWLYEQNPHGRAITWIATDDASGEVAGCTSFFPRMLAVRGATVLGALGGDGCVLPRYRRRGIMRAMHTRSRADMRRLGIEVMFGTPMPANCTPLAGAGSRDVTELVRYVRPLSARAFHIDDPRIVGLAHRLFVPRSRATLVPAAYADPRIDDVWARTKSEIGITTVRDAGYFTWRYFASPSQRQKAFVIVDRGVPIGACALERHGDVMNVVDVVAPRVRFTDALRAIAAHADGCASLEVRVTSKMAAHYRLWRRGYVRRDARPRTLNIVLPLGEQSSATFHDAAAWYVTSTESDLDHS